MKKIITDQNDRVGKWVCERTGGIFNDKVATCIGLEYEGNLIAGVIFDHYNHKSIAMHVAAEGKRWMNKEYLWYCFHYPFNELKIDKILGFVEENNTDARRFDEHLGFKLETKIIDACKGGDLLVYTMTREQCRFLKDRT